MRHSKDETNSRSRAHYVKDAKLSRPFVWSLCSEAGNRSFFETQDEDPVELVPLSDVPVEKVQPWRDACPRWTEPKESKQLRGRFDLGHIAFEAHLAHRELHLEGQRRRRTFS